jgi:hypothetical protein
VSCVGACPPDRAKVVDLPNHLQRVSVSPLLLRCPRHTRRMVSRRTNRIRRSGSVRANCLGPFYWYCLSICCASNASCAPGSFA